MKKLPDFVKWLIIAVVLAGLLFYNLAGAKKREEAPGVK